MPKMHISKSKQINAPVEKVHQMVSDMSTWQQWSPWLITEPEATVDVRSDNKYYSWQGSRVGAGHMEVTNEVANERVDYDLTFLKPWKSTAKISMHTKPKDNGTEVTWTMDSSLPIFMFWMKKMMEGFVGMDYDRGLNLLKDYVEDGKVHSKINHIGEGTYPGCNYLSVKRTCSIDDMPTLMQRDFENLIAHCKDKEGFRIHDAFNIYHKWQVVKNSVTYTAGVPYDHTLEEVPSAFTKGKIPQVKTYTVEHVGPYDHLGNAWSTMYAMHRNKEFKPLKKVHPFETYGNSPMNTDPKDLITRISFPIK